MEFWKAIVLGIIQGVTEFLPISSSGHLVLFQKLFGLEEGALTFDVFLHFGTLIAVVLVFWEDIKNMILLKKSYRQLTLMIIVGTIPTGLMGVLFKDVFAQFFNSLPLVGVMWLITGTLLWASEKLSRNQWSIEKMKISDALTIGLAQGFAIIPGISRAGSTIITGLFRGLKREDAAKYSFLLSLPVIFGATLLEGKDMLNGVGQQIGFLNLALGMLAATISGYLAIRFLLKMIRERTLQPFAYYCWIIGIIAILSRFI